ncbi:DUF1190 domain-containing protein [Pseudomonas japonica]|uniref:Uncharacterized conserved protein YgiB, involved in bioifilm formation, UPF0441/DUF1190 family n=1 Tax=Pseudomonas japonica TaxID=256466 RepID=A0A239LI35_9PSED|nr:DUF1190 domain-containing protein [Pseudomonas japonica]SNT29558.1 Uncharacterized conserved protein YgiB, involved in bioifilm formation, UPF0441/DUF1190 family [Pseudomonas japonica]
MRRPSSTKLLLVGALPLAISGCSDPEQTVTWSVKDNFKNVQACVDAKFPVDVCSDAYIQAMVDHRKVAPVYADRAACDADFVEGYCQPTSDGQFMPQMAGFELAMSGEMPKEQAEQIQQQAAQQGASSSGIGGTVAAAGAGALAGMLIGNAMSNRSAPRYQSQPVYQNRDSRGSYQTSTLSRQIEQGKTFSRSTQPQRYKQDDKQGSSSGYYGGSGSSRSTSSTSAFRSSSGSSVSSSISRGGFGQQASARSGWGGKSSGFGG